MEVMRRLTGGVAGGVGYGTMGAAVGPTVAVTGRALLNLSPYYADHYGTAALEAVIGGVVTSGALGVLHGLRPARTLEQVAVRVAWSAAAVAVLAAPIGAAVLGGAGHGGQLPLGEAWATQLCGAVPWLLGAVCPVGCMLGLLHMAYHRGHEAGVIRAGGAPRRSLAAVPEATFGTPGAALAHDDSAARTPLLSSAASDVELDLDTSTGTRTPSDEEERSADAMV